MDILNILTFNISWGSMSLNTADSTARAIAQKCIDVSIDATQTKCIDNVSYVLKNEANGFQYDIIALQEASNNDIIFSNLNAPTSIPNYYAMVNGTIGREEIATIYNNIGNLRKKV
jgi:hypothetical protein